MLIYIKSRRIIRQIGFKDKQNRIEVVKLDIERISTAAGMKQISAAGQGVPQPGDFIAGFKSGVERKGPRTVNICEKENIPVAGNVAYKQETGIRR